MEQDRRLRLAALGCAREPAWSAEAARSRCVRPCSACAACESWPWTRPPERSRWRFPTSALRIASSPWQRRTPAILRASCARQRPRRQRHLDDASRRHRSRSRCRQALLERRASLRRATAACGALEVALFESWVQDHVDEALFFDQVVACEALTYDGKMRFRGNQEDIARDAGRFRRVGYGEFDLLRRGAVDRGPRALYLVSLVRAEVVE